MASSKDMETSSNLSKNSVKKAYLITYSNTNTEAFGRENFSSAVVEFFHSATTSAVIQWSCCIEQHKNSSYYFHRGGLK